MVFSKLSSSLASFWTFLLCINQTFISFYAVFALNFHSKALNLHSYYFITIIRYKKKMKIDLKQNLKDHWNTKRSLKCVLVRKKDYLRFTSDHLNNNFGLFWHLFETCLSFNFSKNPGFLEYFPLFVPALTKMTFSESIFTLFMPTLDPFFIFFHNAGKRQSLSDWIISLGFIYQHQNVVRY